MSKEILLEGAVAGHMNHIYDNGEMTFGELKQLLQAAVDGKLRGTEKTDGQNVFLSFDVATQRARAIRNKSHIKAGGLNVEEFDDFFSAHPNQALRYSFVEALQAFENVIRSLDRETQLKIFGNKEDNIYFNTEVMNPGIPDGEEGDPASQGTTNVIPYDKKTLLIHEVGHGMFDPKTALPYDDPKTKKRLAMAYTELENAIVGKSTEDPSVFSIETHPRRKLEKAGMERASKVLPDAIKAIDNVVSDFGLNDSNTIQDLVMVQIKPIIDGFGMTEDRNKAFILRLMGLCRSLKDPTQLVPCGTKDAKTGERLHEPPINIRDLTSGLPQELTDEIKQFDKSFKYQDYTAALSNSLYDFTNAILQDFNSSFIADNQKAIKDLQDELKQSIRKIQNSANEAAKKDLEKQLAKLQNVKNVNTPSEGFVFDFNGVTYKFTGWFAPSNQILGTERYGRFGPIEPQETEESGLEGETGPLTIAVVPGAFKPPHKGHLSMVESLAENADKVIVIVSTPLKGGRTLPSGKVIDSDHAVQIWNTYLDNSPAGNKTTVIKSPSASPVGVTYDFVMKEPDPTDLLVAPPNATILLGCGDKEDDQTRFQTIASKARDDLEIKVQVCNLVAKHSNEYMEILDDHPAILEGLPSHNKGTVSVDDLHASDMRYMIDVAAREAIGLTLLQDYVPAPEDALAVMGILGLNPADKQEPVEDQVEEPELDAQDVREMIEKALSNMLNEGFKAQKAPKGKPSSGRFQKKMRQRLKVAHDTYLNKGAGPKGHHGGGFRLDPTLGVSNAYLAEEEVEEAEDVEEVSSMAAGSVAIGSAPLGKKRKTLEEEEEMATEEALRQTIRIGIKEYFKNKKQETEDLIEYIIQEHDLRMSLRELIVEAAAEDPTADVSDSTGINTLKDLLKNTNVLSTLRNVYKTLTTDEDQRLSFRAHIVKWIQDTLAPIRLNDTGEEIDAETMAMGLAENVGVDIEGVDAATQPGDEDKFIDAPDGSEKEQQPEEEEEEEAMQPITGADTTGRNKAERVYPTIEKSIIDYYAELDNPEDTELFYDYLIANVKLYFDKWGGEMSKTVEEPTNQEYEKAKQAI